MFTDPVMDQWHFSIGNSAHLSLTIDDLVNCDRGQSTRICFHQEKKNALLFSSTEDKS